MIIRKATFEDAQGCVDCVRDSQLWDAYFNDEDSIGKIEEEIRKNRVTVAVSEDNQCIGFMSIIEDGCFGDFPYLALLSVHSQYRSSGIGKSLLAFYEKEGFEKAKRVFLLCSDFNKKGVLFYQNNGYEECGQISNLFKKGITEHLFVKYKD